MFKDYKITSAEIVGWKTDKYIVQCMYAGEITHSLTKVTDSEESAINYILEVIRDYDAEYAFKILRIGHAEIHFNSKCDVV